MASGAGTNLEVEKWGAPVRRESGGTGPARSVGKKFFLVVPLHFLALKLQLVVLVSAFVMVSTVWSRCPLCPAICKNGGTCLPFLHMDSAYC